MAQPAILHRIATLTLAGCVLGFSMVSASAQSDATGDAATPGVTPGKIESEGVKGFKAYEAGDYATALKEFLPLAKKGQISAQAAVGQMYFEGKGVSPDPVEAAKWLEPAAKAGNARAQFLLGKLYLSGEGVQMDPAKAAALSKAAADQGFADAQVDVCALYYQGVGVPKDITQAYLYATLAARQDNADAKNILELLNQDMKPDEIAKGDALVKAWQPTLPTVQ
jgi:TPR repeat protein